MTLVASEQVTPLLTGEFYCFIILEGGRGPKRQCTRNTSQKCDPWAALEQESRSITMRCLLWAPRPERQLCSARWAARGGCLSATATKTCTKLSFSGPSWLCPLMLPLTYWFPWTEIISLAAHPPTLLTLLLHNATPRARVEYYIQREKAMLWLKRPGCSGHSLFTTELPVSQQTIGLCEAPSPNARTAYMFSSLETSNCSVPRSGCTRERLSRMEGEKKRWELSFQNNLPARFIYSQGNASFPSLFSHSLKQSVSIDHLQCAKASC